jgi:predicted permease
VKPVPKSFHLEILHTIIPIFLIVILGWGARKRGFMPAEFLTPANRLVFYLAIPAMIFRSISKASLTEQFHGTVLFITLGTAVGGYILAWLVSRLKRIPRTRAGTFIQSSAHGNLGYVGLAVAYYYLGENGLARASIIAGMLMILQNLLSVITLQIHADMKEKGRGSLHLATKIMGNPVILSAIAGIIFSSLKIPTPLIMQRTLDILSGLALPTALLIIGASISTSLMRAYFRQVSAVMFIKLVCLPALGLALFILAGLPAEEFLPGLILLGSPTATTVYVIGREMHGDPDFAVAAISTSTLVSAITYVFWLWIAVRV